MCRCYIYTQTHQHPSSPQCIFGFCIFAMSTMLSEQNNHVLFYIPCSIILTQHFNDLNKYTHVPDQRHTPTHTDSPEAKTIEPRKRMKHHTTIQPLTFLRNMEAAAPHRLACSAPCRLTIHSRLVPAPHCLSTSFPFRPNLRTPLSRL